MFLPGSEDDDDAQKDWPSVPVRISSIYKKHSLKHFSVNYFVQTAGFILTLNLVPRKERG